MTPLLLIPGMMCDARLYTPQISTFSAERPIHCATLTTGDSVQALARDILDQAPPEFALLGLSMGGIVAMEVFAQQPQRVKGLALLDTNPLAEQDEVKARRGPQMVQARHGELAQVMGHDMVPNYLAHPAAHPEITQLCMEMALALGPDVFIRQSQALKNRPDQCNTLKQVQVPSLILCGEQDQLCPLERHQLMSRLMPHAELAVVASAGHLPTLEQPEQTNNIIGRWLHRL
ncbi:MAG: alpha/beta hydrolase [Marinobacterium sp.]|nr:alpha/beta hydrolase [Marinobacterium sp.]